MVSSREAALRSSHLVRMPSEIVSRLYHMEAFRRRQLTAYSA